VNAKVSALVESLEPAFQRLIQMAAVSAETLPGTMPKQGIYLFSKGTEHLYVGRSDNTRRRIGLHCRSSGQPNQALLLSEWLPRNFPFITSRHYSSESGDGAGAILDVAR